ncbi:ABC transporter ATP-binding protein [Kaustia mangrovi]|uniref:ABC transporter ATP-binding protein n=1 Tax=Kaustia mangrovi TaxID=2593653 RepID=A0A7S8HD63_9HYPH|nr:ABC transporter ATP-binding protein [Kaustia mangrovi]QPC44356.1 ABC transporter ATP-binding protein [Kaustia mangrovi]
MANVVLDRVTRRFGGGVAVDNVSLEVGDGEFVIFLGPSGCGKTTTLNMVAGLDSPSDGEIYIGGRAVAHTPPDKRDIAMVFQSIALYPHMTVFDNIAFPLRRARVAKAEIAERVRRVAEMLKVEPFLDRRPHQLSGGQRQRVAIGRAAVREPAVFLFDEPLSSLDAKLRTEMRVELKMLHERLGATFIYVTHDQVEAMTMADRIAVMRDGHLMQYAPPREIYRYPANKWVASFVGSPAMNIVEGRLATRDGKTGLEAAGGAFLPLADGLADRAGRAGGTAAIGIRPEALQVAGDGAADGIAVTGTVHATEPVGSDLFVDVRLGEAAGGQGQQIVKLRTDPDRDAAMGEPIDLVLPHGKLYLFDAAGARVHPAMEAA